MEAMAAARNPSLGVHPTRLLREPLAWAALAAFLGSTVGLAGTFSWGLPSSPSLGFWATPSGGLLAALSLLGVAPMLGGRRSWAAWAGAALLLLWLAASLSFLHLSLRPPEPGPSGSPSLALPVLVRASYWLGSAAALPFALGAFFVARRRRLGAVLLLLSVPGMPLLLHTPLRGIELLVGTLAFPTALGVPEAVLWASLGIVLFGEARRRARGKLRQRIARENGRKARRLYEEGLGKNDPSVVDELVCEDFRDLRRGTRGRIGMERLIADLWASYPDLEVSVEDQEAEGDVVRTRLLILGTDRGRGVIWYPPTGRRVSFGAEFVDRFRGGEVVEHTGQADTAGLLRQLGHREVGRPGEE